jgi:hypothetical protein
MGGITGMSSTNQMLGQAVATTGPVSMYSPATGEEVVIKHITVCNTSNSIVKVSIYRSNAGTTYDTTTVVKYEQDVPAKSTEKWDVYYCMNNENGNLAIEAGASNSITITLDGIVFA